MTTASALETILAELNAANARLGQALRDGDLPTVHVLTRSLSALEAERDRLLALLREPERRAGSKQDGQPKQDRAAYVSVLSSRDRVVQLLRMTSAVSSNRLLVDLSRAVFNSTLDPAGFSTIRRDALRAWVPEVPASSSTAGGVAASGRVYVVPALSHDRFVPVRGVLALSEWPVERRIVAPSSLRVDLLRAVVAVTARAMEDGETSTLGRVVVKFASTLALPTFQVEVSKLYQSVLESCRKELALIEPADRQERERATQRAVTQLDERSLLFGAQLSPLNDRGLRRASPRASRGATKAAS